MLSILNQFCHYLTKLIVLKNLSNKFSISNVYRKTDAKEESCQLEGSQKLRKPTLTEVRSCLFCPMFNLKISGFFHT